MFNQLCAFSFAQRSTVVRIAAKPLTTEEARETVVHRKAVAKLGSLLEADGAAYAPKLAPGKAYIVDNARVLHGRRQVPADTVRHISGADVSEWALRAMWRAIHTM